VNTLVVPDPSERYTGRDGRVGSVTPWHCLGDLGIVPLRDLAAEDVSQHLAGELELARGHARHVHDRAPRRP
jgi:hypothetical protein